MIKDPESRYTPGRRGKSFITVYSEVKEIEHDEFMKVISPWEREHLLLHV